MIELEGGRRVLYQWELNKRVIIDGFLAGTKVEFSTKYDCKDSAIPVLAYEVDGHVYADVPNVLLQKDGYIHVYVNPSAADAEHMPQERDIKVVRRDKPADYEYTETPTVSLESKLDKYWGTENKGKALVIGEDGYITAGEPTSSGGGNVSAEDDGQGNVTINIPGLTVTDDGSGNVVIG